TIPSAGIKSDAVPGRINQITTILSRPGTLSGQCLEICGANHSFIFISISALTPNEFINSMTSLGG
ncbi:cytochrome c oxidase subunit II (mitochondrion)-like protein, partial [Dinothrombium tinctorium]